ncbi:MAG: hypothetical protein K2X93_23505 [Candidatus Obscuribacterales bacterium]|nr:hypothetical protein [Candidatus Obscuribacterales bacterium]
MSGFIMLCYIKTFFLSLFLALLLPTESLCQEPWTDSKKIEDSSAQQDGAMLYVRVRVIDSSTTYHFPLEELPPNANLDHRDGLGIGYVRVYLSSKDELQNDQRSIVNTVTNCAPIYKRRLLEQSSV